MERKNRNGLIGIIVTIIILIILVIFTNSKSSEISIIENIATIIISPIENGLTYLKNKINNNDSFFENIEELKKENEELKIRNSELELTLREYEIIKNENEQLKQQLNLAEKYAEYTTVPGTVISRDSSNYSKTMVSHVGSKNGIQENMTVIADEGLVGYVLSVTENTAKIQTIIDSASATSCLTSTTRDSIICKGTIDSSTDLKATIMETDANIIQGDSVETSGLGGIYVKGIHIGQIKRITEGTNKIDTYATVKTAVDFEKLETVLVITNQ